MTAATRSPARPAAHRERHRRGARRQNAAILVVASLVGLWLGATAPDISPAAPPASTPTAAPTPTQVVDDNPAPPAQARGPRPGGRGR